MNSLVAPDIALGAIALAVAVCYAAWYEYRRKNHRDATLLGTLAVVDLMGSAVSWLQ